MDTKNHILDSQSEDLNIEYLEKFLNIKKSKSNDSFFGLNEFISRPSTSREHRKTLILEDPTQQHQNPNVKIFRKKIKKQRDRTECDYRKNICGYITKKIIREFTGATYQRLVRDLCIKYNSKYEDCKQYLHSEIEHITGPSHVISLLTPHTPQESTLKKPFQQFFQWFLKERYLRYLLVEGKMHDKKAYIHYKNTILLHIMQIEQPSIKKAPIESMDSEEQ